MLIQRIHLSSYYPENFIELEKKAIETLGHTYIYSNELDRDSQVIISSSQVNWTQYSNEQLKNIQLIIHPNSGFDNFSFEQFSQRPLKVILGNSLRADAVSEYTLSCILKHFTSIPFCKQWEPKRMFRSRRLIRESKILIIGHGMVGKRLSKILNSLGSNIHIFDQYYSHQIPEASRIDSLNSTDFLKNENSYDAIILACSLNSKNVAFIGESILQKINQGGCFVNPARGKLVNQKALISFLLNAPNSKAYLDVTYNEPHDFDDFKDIPNVEISSHVAGVYDSLSTNVLSFETQVLQNFSSLSCVDFSKLYQDQLLASRVFTDHFN